MHEAQRRCGSREFTYWQAYERLEPRGDEIDDLRMGRMCSVIANYAGKLRHPTKPEDFMFKIGTPIPKPSIENLRKKWALASAEINNAKAASRGARK